MSSPGTSDWNINFDGRDSNKCEGFVAEIRRYAFSKDKDDDDRWIARFSAACLSGPALRWYDELEEETQRSWKSLRKALSERYPHDDG